MIQERQTFVNMYDSSPLFARTMSKEKTQVERLLLEADVRIHGSRPWDMPVLDERLYARVLSGGSLALGESYMDGWWEAQALDQFFYKILSARLDAKVRFSFADALTFAKALVLNLQSPLRSFQIGKQHYDIGNDLYLAMLDTRLTYTCGYWNPPAGGAKNLDDAQEAKLDLVCRKIGLKNGDHVLDIGCGWGSFLKFAAEKYGARGTGSTVSQNQLALGGELCKNFPIDIRLEDYRQTQGEFDHAVSLGMFEHVGVKNYRTFMQAVHRLLKDDGLFLLHTIGGNRSVRSTNPWIAKYIFPNSMLPSIAQIARAAEGLFVMEDWHNFGADYDKTLMAWFGNFDAQWPSLKTQYSDRFYRMWKYYLLSCAGAFRARQIQLWQIVFSKKGVAGGYEAKR